MMVWEGSEEMELLTTDCTDYTEEEKGLGALAWSWFWLGHRYWALVVVVKGMQSWWVCLGIRVR
jgi:hypothetical protein